MTFTEWVNNNVFILALLLSVLFFIGIRLGYARGGWNRHLVYLWTLFIYCQYILFSPLFFYFNDRRTIIGTDISKYYGTGFFFNCLSILFFLLGYWMINRRGKKWMAPPKKILLNPEKIITIVFYATYGIVLTNMAVGGINVVNVFAGNEVAGLGARGGSYFLQNFADSLVSVLVLAYLFDIPKRKLLTWIMLSFFLFSILGFRYRIMLSLFGLLFVYLFKNKVGPKQVAWSLVFMSLTLYAIIFSTVNRKSLILRQYSQIVYDPLKFKAEGFFEQTRGALADMAIYKLYDNPSKQATYDLGMTTFGYVFVRMIPRTIYPNKDDFYPPPQIKTIFLAYDAYWAKKSGEAPLSVASFYMAWGWIGVVLGHFFWGLLLRKYNARISFRNPFSLAGCIIVALTTFQWITRGYFPQTVDHFVYLMIPLWVLKYFSKKVTYLQQTPAASYSSPEKKINTIA